MKKKKAYQALLCLRKLDLKKKFISIFERIIPSIFIYDVKDGIFCPKEKIISLLNKTRRVVINPVFRKSGEEALEEEEETLIYLVGSVVVERIEGFLLRTKVDDTFIQKILRKNPGQRQSFCLFPSSTAIT